MMRLSEEDDDDMKGFIFSVFGFESQLSKAKFIDIMKLKKVNWIFDPESIRKRFENFFDEEKVAEWEKEQDENEN